MNKKATKKYGVELTSHTYRHYKVEATPKKEAIEKAFDALGNDDGASIAWKKNAVSSVISKEEGCGWRRYRATGMKPLKKL